MLGGFCFVQAGVSRLGPVEEEIAMVCSWREVVRAFPGRSPVGLVLDSSLPAVATGNLMLGDFVHV